MINALLVVFVIAALVIVGIALEKRSSKVREEMIKEIEKDQEVVMPASEVPSEIKEAININEIPVGGFIHYTVEDGVVKREIKSVEATMEAQAPTVSPDVKKLVEAQEAPIEKPKAKKRRGRPAAKKD